MSSEQPAYHAWNPGLTSDIPGRLKPLITLFRPENARVGYDEAREAAEFCGLKPVQMYALRPERLIAHELLIRVTADLSVQDGPTYEVLGRNLRQMTARIHDGYVAPRLAELTDLFEQTQAEGAKIIDAALKRDLFAPPPQPARAGLLARLIGRSDTVAETPDPAPAALARWQAEAANSPDRARRAALRALATILQALLAHRGRLMADADIIARLALNMFTNSHGSWVLGQAVTPIMADAAKAEGYRFLPSQDKPVILNVKGASASGKSTIRPQQRELAETLNLPWEDFALVSPDYWRKYLLDYDSLGDDAKYGAMLTGHELEIIDRKLDDYVQQKAEAANIPHLLIDRFRFDSFAAGADGQPSNRLLTRFGHTVFLFFMITPPEETVQRAWKRGQETGRFKAVDDLLHHNIEAYSGMPHLFFSWLASRDKNVHFEFLDNDVPLGSRPRTLAYGWNDEMVVLRPEGLNLIDRFRCVNVAATSPEEVYDAPAPTGPDFLSQCLERIPVVNFADPDRGVVFARFEEGDWTLAADPGGAENAWLTSKGFAANEADSAIPLDAAGNERKAHRLGR